MLVGNLDDGDGISVSCGARVLVEVGEKHQWLAKNLALVMVQPETTQAGLVTRDRMARRRTAADKAASVVLGQR
jgi:hypothetical protein